MLKVDIVVDAQGGCEHVAQVIHPCFQLSVAGFDFVVPGGGVQGCLFFGVGGSSAGGSPCCLLPRSHRGRLRSRLFTLAPLYVTLRLHSDRHEPFATSHRITSPREPRHRQQ